MPIREGAGDAETIIAASVKVEGEFVSQGNVLIEGVVEGSLKTEKNLRVGQQARISADVSAANAVVAGEVRGNLVVSEKLELEPTARIIGDIRTKNIIVASGAQINGQISMGNASEQRPAAKQPVAAAVGHQPMGAVRESQAREAVKQGVAVE
ncbi:MAG: polymer-forming cytoskeletal protein [Patescibacteria group bacterium]|nr:polymer-forming cytoskeletal protein [Patescibacteria group bacterium]